MKTLIGGGTKNKEKSAKVPSCSARNGLPCTLIIFIRESFSALDTNQLVVCTILLRWLRASVVQDPRFSQQGVYKAIVSSLVLQFQSGNMIQKEGR